MNAEGIVEQVARESYGRLLAYLAVKAGDVSSAEDALGDALLQALQRWPEDGPPANPEGWLLAVAKRRLVDGVRRRTVRERGEPEVRHFLEEALDASARSEDFPDERLKLLFVCAHPAIDPAARTPLMLQTILGLEADRIACAFLTSPTAMSQRLVRAKSRIRAAGIPFRIPNAEEYPGRAADVLDAIYAAYSAGWNCSSEGGNLLLASEAVFLSRMLVRLLPDEPEAAGLLSLILHCEARREARFSEGGATFVPLPAQDPQRWNASLIDEAEGSLAAAAGAARPGRYQLEAAIQSVHSARRITGTVDWRVIVAFYDRLLEFTAGSGAVIGRAAALAESGDPASALTALDEISRARVECHQPYWATRAHVLERCGLPAEAVTAWRRAIGLTETPALREYLAGRLAVVEKSRDGTTGAWERQVQGADAASAAGQLTWKNPLPNEPKIRRSG